MNVPRYIADFDSAAAMMRSLGRFLEGCDFPKLGKSSPLLAPLTLVNWLPDRLRQRVYILGGWIEAIPPERIGDVDSEDIARWVTDHYPPRRYPAVMIGSSNGAAVHLCAALGIPWLPQTFLIPIRHNGIHPDEPRYAAEALRRPAEVLLRNNPDLQLHHMHDANQDQLMIRTMAYFRVKRRRLGATWERFLTERLNPGGTIFILDCQHRWPTHRMDERHYFQFGAVGGLTAEEYHRGSRRISEFMARHGSHRRSWDPPEPDTDRPEAEWGFEQALGNDVERFALKHNFQVRRIVFNDPADLSPWTADFHRLWNWSRGMPAERLLAESFIVMEPWWVLRTGSVPFWMVFNKQPSAAALAQYLNERGPFEELYVMLFSHGVKSIGLAPISQWRELLGRATRHADFLGVDERSFPRDFATFIRYHTDLPTKIRARYELPQPMDLSEFDRLAREVGTVYPVSFEGAANAVVNAESENGGQ